MLLKLFTNLVEILVTLTLNAPDTCWSLCVNLLIVVCCYMCHSNDSTDDSGLRYQFLSSRSLEVQPLPPVRSVYCLVDVYMLLCPHRCVRFLFSDLWLHSFQGFSGLLRTWLLRKSIWLFQQISHKSRRARWSAWWNFDPQNFRSTIGLNYRNRDRITDYFWYFIFGLEVLTVLTFLVGWPLIETINNFNTISFSGKWMNYPGYLVLLSWAL